jgi:hypothetical protein
MIFLAIFATIVGYFAAATLIESLRRVVTNLTLTTNLNGTIWVELSRGSGCLADPARME